MSTEITQAEEIDITGVDRVQLIQRLYRRAKVLSLAVLQNATNELSQIEAKSLVGKKIDYLNGKVMKINVPFEGNGNSIESFLYDRDNGHQAAKSVVDALRAESSHPSLQCAETLNGIETPEFEFGHSVALSNGARAPSEIVRSVARTLFSLSESLDIADHIALVEITMKCRFPRHELFGNVGKLLLQKGLILPDGTITTDVKNIVLSAIKGDPLSLCFHSPLYGAS